MGVNASYSMTCDCCHRHLMDAQVITETGDLRSLLDKAEGRGWLLDWEFGAEPGAAPDRTTCPDCAAKPP